MIRSGATETWLMHKKEGRHSRRPQVCLGGFIEAREEGPDSPDSGTG